MIPARVIVVVPSSRNQLVNRLVSYHGVMDAPTPTTLECMLVFPMNLAGSTRTLISGRVEPLRHRRPRLLPVRQQRALIYRSLIRMVMTAAGITRKLGATPGAVVVILDRVRPIRIVASVVEVT